MEEINKKLLVADVISLLIDDAKENMGELFEFCAIESARKGAQKKDYFMCDAATGA